MFCGKCGTKNEEGAKFCESCGNKLEQEEKEKPTKKAKKNKTGIAGNITDRTGGEQSWNWKC